MIGGGVVFFVFFVCIFVFNFWRLLVKALFFPLFTPACLFYVFLFVQFTIASDQKHSPVW